ncbi:MAG TPA: hypothetical protein VIT43_05005 [Candidatus Dormibacteraeota bacterium]
MAQLPLVEPSPRDRCTFRRPFAPDFHDCPAFEAAEFRTTDMRGYPLEAVITCAHLGVGLMARFGSSYPRCLIGSPAERAAFGAERTMSAAG